MKEEEECDRAREEYNKAVLSDNASMIKKAERKWNKAKKKFIKSNLNVNPCSPFG